MTRVMWDSVTVGEIPRDANAVAGYAGGLFPTFPVLVKEWPHADHLEVAINLEEDGDILDCEAGDVDPTDFEGIEGWVRRMKERGRWRPGPYASQSNMGAIVRYLVTHGHKRGSFRVWSAHYIGPHICSPETCRLPDGQPCDFSADGTQYGDHALGRNLDVSLLHDDFFPHAKPKPRKAPKPKVTAAGLSAALSAGILGILHGAGVVHLTTAETGLIGAVAAFLAGYVKRD